MTEPASQSSPQPVAKLVKPGYLTTEFYLAWAAKITGILMVSGLLGAGSQAERICGAVIALLAQLGYTYSRTIVKTAALLLLVLAIGGGSQVSCAQTRDDLDPPGDQRCTDPRA